MHYENEILHTKIWKSERRFIRAKYLLWKKHKSFNKLSYTPQLCKKVKDREISRKKSKKI